MFNLFLKNTPADIAMFDTNLRHIAVSRRYCESVCLPADDLIDKKTLLDLFPVHPDYWVDAIKDVLTKGTPANSEGNECAILWNGRTKWCNWQVFPGAKLDDSIGGMILLSEDVTEEMSLRAELLNKNIRIVPKGNFPELTNSDVRMYSRM
jgi:PAS domain S-box-containing protein